MAACSMRGVGVFIGIVLLLCGSNAFAVDLHDSSARPVDGTWPARSMRAQNSRNCSNVPSGSTRSFQVCRGRNFRAAPAMSGAERERAAAMKSFAVGVAPF